MTRVTTWLFAAAALLEAGALHAQPLGTFRWQLQPYCNVVAVAVTQAGAVYRLEGTDDQCGGGRDLASVQGLAFPNQDGTIGFGLTIVTTPGGAPVHVDAEIALATLGGTWRDSTGNSGTFAFTPGAGTGGSPRPPASPPAIPPAFLLAPTGSFLATGALNVGAAPASGPSVRMMWYPGKAAFRAGQAFGPQWDDANIGLFSTALGAGTTANGGASMALGSGTTAVGFASTAMGESTTANGSDSTAMGFYTTASGSASTAMGFRTTAIGTASTAMGDGTTANGVGSTAMGYTTTASGDFSTAMGSQTRASGPGSTAMGIMTLAQGNYSTAMGDGAVAAGHRSTAMGLNTLAGGVLSLAAGSNTSATGDFSTSLGTNATTNAQRGSFIYGDGSTTGSGAFVGNDAPNQFMVRAAGGYKLFSNSAISAGVQLAPGGNSWASLSDANAKENFREVDGEALLAKLAAMSIQEWNYKAQDAAIRHMGPTAQEFRAAFGLGDFPLRINTVDADGVALAGVKALDARTRGIPQQAAEFVRLLTAATSDIAVLHDIVAALRRELEALKAGQQHRACHRHVAGSSPRW